MTKMAIMQIYGENTLKKFLSRNQLVDFDENKYEASETRGPFYFVLMINNNEKFRSFKSKENIH